MKRHQILHFHTTIDSIYEANFFLLFCHQLNENGKWVNLIPSLTGGVYKYDGDSLYPMPFNADSLLKKSFKLSNDVVITG